MSTPRFEDADLYRPNDHDRYSFQQLLNEDLVEQRLQTRITSIPVVEDSQSCIKSLERYITGKPASDPKSTNTPLKTVYCHHVKNRTTRRTSITSYTIYPEP